jgi:sulfatase maturation enzyme AslB (radical SAM superfamily)
MLGNARNTSVEPAAINTASDLARVFTTPCDTSPIKTELLMSLVRRFSRDELRAAYAHDPLMSNYVVNHWEFATGETTLTTYPWRVVVPVSDVCNATCTFCNSWLRGIRTLDLLELDRFEAVLRHAAEIGLEGHGEPLVHPEIETLLTRLAEIVDPRCWKYMITNGARLHQYFELLQRLRINTYSISLNAATAATHQDIMGLGPDAFDRIVDSIKRLISVRNAYRIRNPNSQDDVQVHMTFVVVNQNVGEIGRFIELANELDVNKVWLRTLLPQLNLAQGLNYHLLPPYENPEFERYRREAVAAIERSRVGVSADPGSWSAPVFPQAVAEAIRVSPPIVISKADAKRNHRADLSPFQTSAQVQWRGRKRPEQQVDEPAGLPNPFNREPPYMCTDVYSVWHWNDFLNLIRPCCYMEHPPGYEYLHYDGSYDFFEAWNSPALVEIRRSLRHGPLISWCKRCPRQPQYA